MTEPSSPRSSARVWTGFALGVAGLAALTAGDVAFSPADREELLATVEESADRLEDLVENLAARRVTRDGADVRLTPTEWHLLEVLVRNAGRLGLGLAIARGFTQAMGGTVTPSDTPGGGMTMTVSIPRSSA